ncbi:alpha/beta hydrolase fold domain-containing protein [Staphylococcus cohnii]
MRQLSYILFGKAYLTIQSNKHRKRRINQIIENNRKKNDSVMLSKDQKKLYSEYDFEGMQILSFNETKSSKCILYFHGGGFISPPTKYHFDFISKIAQKTHCEIIMPIHPKIPNNNYYNVIPKIFKFYYLLQKKKGSIYLMGDSSGGTLSLNLLIEIQKQRLPPPKKMVLFSPWVDLNTNHHKINKYNKKDSILHLQLLKAAKFHWTKSIKDIESPYINPIYGDFSPTTSITSIVTDRELFYPDIIKFHNKLNLMNVENEVFELKGLFHDFMIMPIKEQKLVLNYLSKLIN